jgi:predicted ATP-grasp superfamily ATP-dependent carboligase
VSGPERLFEMIERPELDNPVMVVALDGWIDAGMAASTTVSHMMAASDLVTVATFDTDALLDHRARRPVMHLVDGCTTELVWPHLEVRAGTDADGNDVLYVVGAEPDHQWRAFARCVVDIALECGVRMVIDLGAYPAPVAHTRPVRVVATATTAELAEQVGFMPGRIEVPAGVAAAVERRCAEVGLPAVGLWAQVPHYAAALPAPSASLAHLGMLEVVAGLRFDTTSLATEAASTIEHINALVSGNPEHEAMVTELERRASLADDGFLITGDELAAEVEEFLREEGE